MNEDNTRDAVVDETALPAEVQPEELVVTEEMLAENPEMAEAGVEVGTVGEVVSAEEVAEMIAPADAEELA